MLIGDKAYEGRPSVVSPFKGRALEKEKQDVNKYLQMVRSPVERAFARLHRFRLLRYCGFSPEVTDHWVVFVASVDMLLSEQSPTDFVTARSPENQDPQHLVTELRPTGKGKGKKKGPQEEVTRIVTGNEVRESVIGKINRKTARLRGKNSKKRGKRDPAFKRKRRRATSDSSGSDSSDSDDSSDSSDTSDSSEDSSSSSASSR